MKKDKVAIACCQMQSGLGTKDDNIAKMCSMLDKVTSEKDVDLVIFPELAINSRSHFRKESP